MNARQRGMSIKSDINKQGWQKSDFPVACQKCYGQNPYMRMLKQNYGQECRLCFRPFTVFKWKGDRGIYKRTCICNSCSKQKNLCQFGLPMEVRDKRCGVNGKYLMNENFVNETSRKIKPPPPSTPPPVPKNAYEQKQAVYIPDQQNNSQQQQANQKQQKIGTDQQQPQSGQKPQSQQKSQNGEQQKKNVEKVEE